MLNYENERRVAIEAVIKACLLCQRIREKNFFDEAIEKQDKSPVTVADFTSQAVISQYLINAFPNDPIAAEERLADLRTDLRENIIFKVKSIFSDLSEDQILANIDRCDYQGGTSGRFWALDPIDGTKGFIRGDQYAIALALIEDGEVVLGVLGCPNLPYNLNHPKESKGCLLVAVKGQGSRMRLIEDPAEMTIKVAEVEDPAAALLCESIEPAHSSHNHSAQIAKILGVKSPPFRIDSQCKYGIVARGDATIYLRVPGKSGYEEKIWDHAAGWLIVKEAGGEVTDIHGYPIDFSTGRTLSKNKGIVATNGKLHDQVLSAVRKVLRAEEK